MKRICFILPVHCFFSFQLLAQVSSVGMSNEFNSITHYGSRQTGFEGLQTYSTHNVNGSQFFNDTWSAGSVTSPGKNIFSSGYLFLYDKVRQQLFVKQKDSDLVVLIDKNQIYSFTITTDKPHLFQRASLYDPSNKNDFFELLAQNNDYTLLKLNSATFEKANPNDMEKVKNGIFEDAFVDHVTHYLYHKNKLQKIALNENSIRKALRDQQDKVDEFFSLHENDEMTETLLLSLINQLNP
jgi:hypothetical protein